MGRAMPNPQSSIAIRRARARDLPTLLGLVERYWRFERVEGFSRARIAPPLQNLLSESRLGCGWLALVGGRPAGYLLSVYVFSLEHLGMTSEIDEFFVLPEFRGRGVGACLLQSAEETFLAAGCTNVSLQLGRTNEAGRRFYSRRGYRPRSGYELMDKMLVAGGRKRRAGSRARPKRSADA